MRRDLLPINFVVVVVAVLGRFGRLVVISRRRRMARAIDGIAPTVRAATTAARRHGWIMMMMVASTRIDRGAKMLLLVAPR